MPLMFCAIARPMVSWIARQCAHVVVSAAAAAALGLPGFRRFLPELLPEQPSLSSSSSSTASDRPGRGLANMRMPTLGQLIGPTIEGGDAAPRERESTRVGYPRVGRPPLLRSPLYSVNDGRSRLQSVDNTVVRGRGSARARIYNEWSLFCVSPIARPQASSMEDS
eukprot:scaffold16961_cov69-Phaeocystis_antarctica.AAC.2